MIPSLFSYLSPEEGLAICKLAEREKKKNRALEVAKAIGIPAAGFGVGSAVGLGGGLLADRMSRKLTGHPIPDALKYKIAPALGSLGGLAAGLYQRHVVDDVNRALQSHRDPAPSGR